MSLKDTAVTTINNVKTYWREPMKGRYMSFREIAAYSGGGIGAYFIITLGTACLLATGNTLISSTLGVDATDMYILYVIAVLANIPLTGIRANIIDNTRNKAGKYRPYIVTMGIPTAIICVLMVWFPYDKLESIVGQGMIFGETKAYVAKCAIILILNLFLHFFYYFFYDGYENLIHVLSPNSQERADVSSVKSVVYSFAPTVVNLITPIIASNIFHTNSTDIRVYRLLYPILGVLGIALCIVVYRYTSEKIVQAKTHVIQIKFTDALREVAKNKYFWIIALAGWIGFLESAYSNILSWLYNYGGVCSGNVFGIVQTVYGNASLWGMILAPFCIRRWGKKSVLVITNMFNIAFILLMLPATTDIGSSATIWLVLGCLYLNAFMGSFAHILNPAIQADIRDYQQYKSGERIDGMFSAVNTIGNVITLLTSSVLPIIYERGGITKENAVAVTSNPSILNRMLGDGQTVGEILSQQLANGQDNYTNAYSALYDPDILSSLLHVLILVSALGALMNVIPYFWYDFNEKKQKSVVRVLKVRAMFEDYDNGALSDKDLVETIDMIREARINAAAQPKQVAKDYKKIRDKAEKKAAKKAYREDLKFNEEIEISKFVCGELDKFSDDVFKYKVNAYEKVYNEGLEGLRRMKMSDIKAELKAARAMPKQTNDEKEIRKFAVEVASKKKSSRKFIDKYYSGDAEFKQPEFSVLEGYFKDEDNADDLLKELYLRQREAAKAKDRTGSRELRREIEAAKVQRNIARKNSKNEMDKHAQFNRAAKAYLDAEKLINQRENYSRFSDIDAMYAEAKVRAEQAEKEEDERKAQLEAERKAHEMEIKAKKAKDKENKRKK
ncbi:MAG: MFS transporter [Clostridiales bacterium]|nr:MFS transporter [Clostridiales bacterium]